MALRSENLSDETVELLSDCLSEAVKVAAEYVQMDDVLLDQVADVIVESWEEGCREPDKLIAQALKALPITR